MRLFKLWIQTVMVWVGDSHNIFVARSDAVPAQARCGGMSVLSGAVKVKIVGFAMAQMETNKTSLSQSVLDKL